MISNENNVIKVNDIAHPLEIIAGISNGVSTNPGQKFANILSVNSPTEVINIPTGGKPSFSSNYLLLKLNNYSINDLYPPCNELHINSLIFKVQNTGTTSFSYDGFKIIDKNNEDICSITPLKPITILSADTRYVSVKGIYSFNTSSWKVKGSIMPSTTLPSSITPLSNKCVKVADLGVKISTTDITSVNEFYYKCDSAPESSVLMFNNDMPLMSTTLINTNATISLGIMLPFTKTNPNSKYFYIKNANFKLYIQDTAVKTIWFKIYANSNGSYFINKSLTNTTGAPIVQDKETLSLTISNGLLDLETSTWVEEPGIKLN
jgi:hypothetical protein